MSDKKLIPISLATLEPSDALAWDLYLLPRDSNQYILYRASNYPITSSDLEKLVASGITRLYISREQRASYQQYLRDNADAWLNNSAVPLPERMETLNQVVTGSLSESFRKKEAVERVVGQSSTFGRQTAAFFAAEPILFEDLVRVLQHDYTTFAHSANVCFYSVLLAKHLGFSGDDLAQIATGALLHDLGKLEIDPRLLVKDNRLTEAETREMQKHPTLGFRRLCRQDDLTAAQLLMVYQHHERLDGGGYPVGLTNDEIHPWAKLCSVVDVFDALTSDRPYRTAIADDIALGIMHRDANTAFDSEMLTCWTRLISTSDAN